MLMGFQSKGLSWSAPGSKSSRAPGSNVKEAGGGTWRQCASNRWPRSTHRDLTSCDSSDCFQCLLWSYIGRIWFCLAYLKHVRIKFTFLHSWPHLMWFLSLLLLLQKSSKNLILKNTCVLEWIGNMAVMNNSLVGNDAKKFIPKKYLNFHCCLGLFSSLILIELLCRQWIRFSQTTQPIVWSIN